jgi:hypothetical protein
MRRGEMQRAASGQRAALVRPPRFASGGGAALPNGSGAPGLPAPGSKRAAMLARQYRDDARGRFTERDFVFTDSGVLAPAASSASPQSVQIVSNRTSFVRLVAIRGSITFAAAVGAPAVLLYNQNIDEANLRLRLQINGEEDMITTGSGDGFASYADLFTVSAPWYWFAAPPRLRISDQLQASWDNTYGTGGVPALKNLAGSLTARIVDDAWWRALYGT